jgi:hypothetical protein
MSQHPSGHSLTRWDETLPEMLLISAPTKLIASSARYTVRAPVTNLF